MTTEHDTTLIAAVPDALAHLNAARRRWQLRGPEAAFAQLVGALGWGRADAIRCWIEAEKAARMRQLQNEWRAQR